MKDIKCPSCGKTFNIDPSSFEEILLQIKDEEFNKQINERLILAEEDNKKSLEILKQELKLQLIEQNRNKEFEIQDLQNENVQLKEAEDEFVDDSGYTVSSHKTLDRSISTADIELANKINILKESGLI